MNSAAMSACLKAYGSHSQAFSTLQPGLSYFCIPGLGYLAYAERLGVRCVLSDPVCHPMHRAVMLDAFMAEHSDALFVQASKPVIDHLHRNYGYYGTQFGTELKVDFATWSLGGSKKKVIRTAVNQARCQGIAIRESAARHDVEDVSQAWIRTRRCSRNEIGFLIRPATGVLAEGTRMFYAYRDGKAIGFIFFDPSYVDGRVVSYVPNVSRASASFRQGLWYALMAHAMEAFRSESIPQVDLGLVPLMMDENLEPQESRPLRRTLAFIRERMDFLYNFKGLEFAKTRFQGACHKTYCAHRSALPLLSVIALLRLTRLI